MFVTGATGFVGSAVVQELVKSGHTVLGLARNETGAKALVAMGAEPLLGSLDDLDSLKRGAAAADAVMHLAFVHDWANFVASCDTDRRAIEAIGAALAGSNKPFLVTSGMIGLSGADGGPATEESVRGPDAVKIPRVSEEAALALVPRGVRAMVVRLPPSVHGDGDHGFVPHIVRCAREHQASAYAGDGRNRWPAVHRLDAAAVYRLAMEKGAAGAVFHAVADEGVAIRDVAAVVGRRLGVPVAAKTAREDVAAHFGFLAIFVALDAPASSKLTQARLGWRPKQCSLLEDLERGTYFD